MTILLKWDNVPKLNDSCEGFFAHLDQDAHSIGLDGGVRGNQLSLLCRTGKYSRSGNTRDISHHEKYTYRTRKRILSDEGNGHGGYLDRRQDVQCESDSCGNENVNRCSRTESICLCLKVLTQRENCVHWPVE